MIKTVAERQHYPMALSSTHHHYYQHHICRTLVTVAQSSDGRARLHSFNSRIQGASFNLIAGNGLKPMTSEKCFVISEWGLASKHSLRHSLMSRAKNVTEGHSVSTSNEGVVEWADSEAHDNMVGGDLVTDEEAVEWVNREVHDPMVEVDPVTVSGQILAEKELLSAEDISTSIKTTSLPPFNQNARGFNWIVMAVAFALTLGVVVAISQILKSRKTNKVQQLGAGSETKKMDMRRKVIEETIKATQDALEEKRASSAAIMAQKQKLEQSLIGRFESKRLTEQTLSNNQKVQVEKVVIAEQKNKPKYVTEALSHASGDAFPPLSVPLPAASTDNLAVDVEKTQNGGAHSVGLVHTYVHHPLEKKQIGEVVNFVGKEHADHIQDSKFSFPTQSDLHNLVQTSTDAPGIPAPYDSSFELSARPIPIAEPEPESSEIEIWEEVGSRERENFNKALQAAVPAVAVGMGAVGALAGVAGGLQVVGFAATASLLTRDLIWAQTREKLWQDLRNITDRQKLQEFLAKRDILPESWFNGASSE